MAAKIPGYASYYAPPIAVNVGAFLENLANHLWSQSHGNTAILLVEMPADGNEVSLVSSAYFGSSVDVPDNSLNKAKRDIANSLAFGMTSLPLRYLDVANGGYCLLANAPFTVNIRWLAITEPGD